mmetsp:Transcript_1119/g.3159  ORF Transcript_1119/g.3159 Transcript_1119/m.3159 type:complete len:553 (+) Transcript_1119:3068-4726(+)
MDTEDDDDEAGALFQQMMTNLSMDETQNEQDDADDGILGSSFRDRLRTLRQEADLSIDLAAADPFDLLNDSLLEEEDDGATPTVLPFLNIQLMACKKLNRALELIYKRRLLSSWSSFMRTEREAESTAVAHHIANLSCRTLQVWQKTTRHRVHRRETALKSLECNRRRLVLRSGFWSWVVVHARRRFVESLSATILRCHTKAALQLWHRNAKVKGISHLFEASVLRQSVLIWRDAVIQAKLLHSAIIPSPPSQVSSETSIQSLVDTPDSLPPPPPPPITDNVCPTSTPAPVPPVSSSTEEKKNIRDARRNIPEKRVNTTTRKPKLLVAMEQRQAARLERRQQARKRKERELVAKKEAEEKARADQERRKVLLMEQRRLATEMARLHRTASFMRRHFHLWKAASVVKNEWDNRKAYVLWSDTVLDRGFSGWRAVTTAAQKERTERADAHYLRRPFAVWREQTRHVRTNLGQRIVEISTHHRKKRAFDRFLAQHYQTSKDRSRLERIARKRARAQVLRSALAGWKVASVLHRTEREIDERVQEKKREIARWLDG